MIRNNYLEQIKSAFDIHPVVALLGPRQCGKTTLAKQLPASLPQFSVYHYVDLEHPLDLQKLTQNPVLFLQELQGLVIIDEIQRLPDLFPLLRSLVDADRKEKTRQFLILGSASRDLIRQSSETLAGRIQYIELTPFNGSEVDDLKRLWMRGGFPESYLAHDAESSFIWRREYIRTYLERDIPNLGFRIPAQTLRRFWMMLSDYHGNIFNASELGKSLQISGNTVRHYLDILTGTFMVRELLPWFENISKRQVKSPKIYFRDSGIYHGLLGLADETALWNHPKLGASWEGAALEEIINCHQALAEECYFWGVHAQAELDLLMHHRGQRLGFEFKFTDKPSLTKSMRVSMETLRLNSLTIISPGDHDFPLSEGIRAMGLNAYLEKFKKTSTSMI